jgi:ribosomal protein S18 acetylase RimI-like enzyme
MQPATYPAYLDAAILAYAQENIESGRWPEAGAIERSTDDFNALLPAGIATPDHYLFEVLEHAAGSIAGFVWYALEHRHGSCQAFIYDLVIHERYRRQGHARRALQALEQHARSRGATAMGLNVFATNQGAQQLYQELGYIATNVNMSKPLPP